MISSRSNVHAHFSEKETGSKPFALPEGAVRRELRESNMNNKAIAVLAVVVMAISGCAVAMSEQSEAADTNLGTVYIDKEKTTAEVELRFNEYAYTQYSDYEFTISANFGSESSVNVFNNKTTLTPGDVPVPGGKALDIDVSKVGVGVYKITVKNSENNAAESGRYVATLGLSVNAYQDGGVVDLNNYTYSLTINVRSYETVNFTTSGDMTAGVSGEFILAPTDETFNVSKYDWYATGLATGLNIGVLTNGDNGENQGKLAIYGMTAKSDDEIKMDSIKIVGRDAYGNEVWAKVAPLTIKATPEITYTIKVGEEKVDPTSEGSNVFLFESGGISPVLTVTTADGDDRAVTISVFNLETGKRVGTVGKTLTLDISEVGRYVVEMTVYFGADSTTTNTTGLTTTAIIEVVPNITGAGAGFIVVGGN